METKIIRSLKDFISKLRKKGIHEDIIHKYNNIIYKGNIPDNAIQPNMNGFNYINMPNSMNNPNMQNSMNTPNIPGRFTSNSHKHNYILN